MFKEGKMKESILNESPLLMKKFLGYLQTVKGKSPKTVEEYFLDLRTFFRYMKVKRHAVNNNTEFEDIAINDIDIEFIKTITLIDVFEYMNYLLDKRGNHEAARARKASSLRVFFDYLTNKLSLLESSPVKELETAKLGKRLPKFLNLEQSFKLLNTVLENGGEFKERDYCIITLFLNCGMRLSELVGINFNDIRADGTLRLIGKGNKERIVYINDACKEAIEKYKKVRPVDGLKERNAFFISRHLKRISPKTVQHLVNKYLDLAGLSGMGYSVHKLRHTAATLMYQYGNTDIRILKEILGHENLGTTEIYTHVCSKQIQNAINSNPLGAAKNKAI